MSRFVQLPSAEPGETIVLVNPVHVVAVIPCWDRNDMWTHCDVALVTGRTLAINASLEQIEDTLEGLQEGSAAA